MQYLESSKIVHRDLATRNILMDTTKLVKVSDFGFSRILRDKDYYRSTKGGNWPIKWSAPETLTFYKFNHQSDIWSYGVTLWEIYTFAEPPYHRDFKHPSKYLQCIVDDHLRLEKPEICPDEIYVEMAKCWDLEPKNRSTFSDFITFFGNLK